MSKDAVDFNLPSDPAARRKIKDAIYEISGVTQEIKDKRSYISDTKKMLKTEFGMPPKIATKMAKTVHEHNFQEVVAESEAFTATYEVLFEGGSTASSTDTE